MTAVLHEVPLFELAEAMRARFAPGLTRLAREAGLERQELPGEAILITAEALRGYAGTRGDFVGRWWHFCRRRFARQGWAAGGGEMPAPAGGDDPLEILLALEAIEGLVAAGLVAAAMAPESGPARSQRRHRARLAGAAREYGCGPQRELCWGRT